MPSPPRAPLTLKDADASDTAVLERLWQLYRHDLSEFRDSWTNQDGLFPLHDLHTYVAGDAARAACLLYDGEHLAGFVTVAGLTHERRTLDDFFVLRRARRVRLGQHAAVTVLTRWPGTWEIGFQENNIAAARFWRKIADLLAPSEWRVESRPVPNKPWIPKDTFVIFRAPSSETVDRRILG